VLDRIGENLLHHWRASAARASCHCCCFWFFDCAARSLVVVNTATPPRSIRINGSERGYWEWMS